MEATGGSVRNVGQTRQGELQMLGADGFLPGGRHQVTDDEFRHHFVDAFAGSRNRRRLFLRWQQHRKALLGLVPIEAQWLNGSYVTAKPEPGDIDVVSLIDGPTFEALPEGERLLVNSLLAGKQTKAVWSMDSYGVLLYPDGHPGKSTTEHWLVHWDWEWSRVRGDDDALKGYLEVRP